MAGFPVDFLIFFLTGSFVGDPAVCCAPPALTDDAVGEPSSVALRFNGLPAPPLGPAELLWGDWAGGLFFVASAVFGADERGTGVGRLPPKGLGTAGSGLPARLPAPPASGLEARFPEGVEPRPPFFGAGLVAR